MNDNELVRILVVDDDDYQRTLLSSILQDHYEVIKASCGEQGIDLAHEYLPSLILMDISMPGISGYQTCSIIKADEELSAIPVIFMSGLTELEDRLAAYNCGGEDFIGKPYAPDELLNKINRTFQKVKERARLTEEVKMAASAAMTALSNAGELGVIIECWRASFSCNDYDTLIKVILQAIHNFGLHASIQIRGVGGVLSRNELGESSRLETQVFAILAEQGRIVEFNKRAAFNYEHVSILIRNMPKNDPDRYGRLRDHLTMLAEGVNARVYALDAELIKHAQQQAIINMIEKTHKMLLDIEQRHENHRLKATNIMHTMLEQIETTFFNLQLDDLQEKEILVIINNAMDKILNLYAEGLTIEVYVKSVIEQLKAATQNNNAAK